MVAVDWRSMKTAQELADRQGLARGGAAATRAVRRAWYDVPAALYGLLLGAGATAVCVSSAVLLTVLSWRAQADAWSAITLRVLGASSMGVMVGLLFFLLDLFLLLPRKRLRTEVMYASPRSLSLTVALTAYNHESSIGQVVDDFRKHALVRHVIVVDNNSQDGTAQVAKEHGASVVREKQQGYGYCAYRGLSEACAMTDTDLTLLCEGDATFHALDIDKFAAYIAHADIVNGTRIVEQLRSRRTQLTTFMYYGNFFVGKLLELKHLGKGTFTDVGTTYKLCRNDALRSLLPRLNPEVNLEFNAHFMDTALQGNLLLLECPITFSSRVGASKGGNASNRRALAVGLRMIAGLLLGWKRRRAGSRE